MPFDQHPLVLEFPQHKDIIRQLRNENAQFAELFEQLQELDREIVRIESGEKQASDAYLDILRKQRTRLRSGLDAILHQAA